MSKRHQEKKTFFSDIYDLHADELLNFVFHKVSDKLLTEDIVADAFAKFWEKVLNNESIHNARALLYTMVRSQIIDHYRSKKIRQHVPLEDVIDTLVHDGFIAGKMDSKREYAKVMLVLQQLKQEYSDMLILHYVQEFSVSEISELLNEKENNVRVRLHRALGSLRKKLDYEK